MLVLLSTVGLIFSGCSTTPGMNIAASTNVKTGNFPNKPLDFIDFPKYSVVGTVVLEKNWFGVLGFSTSAIGRIPPIDFYIWQAGGINYNDLLKEAKKTYGDVDAVVDINVDYSGSFYLYLFSHRKITVTGIAIKYSRDEVGK